MILMRVGNQKTPINNKFRVIEQKYVFDPIKQNILEIADLVSIINEIMTY